MKTLRKLKPDHLKKEWVLSTLGGAVKEMIAVIAALLCYSRVGLADRVYSGMCLYVILVVFAFPFLNPYLYFFLRFGPWAAWDKVDSQQKKLNTVLRYLMQFAFVAAFQCLGAFAAAQIRKALDKVYNGEYTPPDPPVSSKNVSDYDKGVGYFMDEMFCVLFLLIGLVHLIHFYLKVILQNVFWKGNDKSNIPEENSDSEKIRNITTRLLKYVKEKGITTFSPYADTCTLSTAERTIADLTQTIGDDKIKERPSEDAPEDNPSPNLGIRTESNPIHGNLIAAACLLVSCLSVAFPSANQSAHVTVYLASMGFADQFEVACRLSGGTLGTLLALAYYYTLYVAPAKYPVILDVTGMGQVNAAMDTQFKSLPIEFKLNI
jgi:hypothetical protein